MDVNPNAEFGDDPGTCWHMADLVLRLMDAILPYTLNLGGLDSAEIIVELECLRPSFHSMLMIRASLRNAGGTVPRVCVPSLRRLPLCRRENAPQ